MTLPLPEWPRTRIYLKESRQIEDYFSPSDWEAFEISEEDPNEL